MHLYKVSFACNKAIATRQIVEKEVSDIKIEQVNGQSEIRWLIIYADDEEESLRIADRVLTDYNSYFCYS